MRKCRKLWWSQRGRRWQYGGALHAGLVRLHARQAYASVCAPTPTHTRTREDTHKYVRLVACLRQQWFRERASVSRYTCIACLVSN